MLRRACLGLALMCWGCTERVLLRDVWDSGPQDADPRTGMDSGSCLKYTPLGPAQVQPAELWILLDRSLSMQAGFDNTTRQAAVQAALQSAIVSYEGSVNFGFVQFPAGSLSSEASNCQINTCCAGSAIPPAPNNWPALEQKFQCSALSDSHCDSASADSPSHAALAKVDSYYSAETGPPWGDSRYVLLVTSSDPSCAADNSDLCYTARSTVSHLLRLGVGVVVLSVGAQPTPDSCLGRISKLGSGATSHGGATLYSALTFSDLTDAVTTFVLRVAENACTVDLTGIRDIPKDQQLVVSFDNSNDLIQKLDSYGNGWTFAGNSRITFSGPPCDQIVQGNVSEIQLGACN
jgi:hypothetical protein